MTVAALKTLKSHIGDNHAASKAPVILESSFQSGIFIDKEQEKTCKLMVSQLSENEIEHAARTSYGYFVAVLESKNDPSKSKPSDEQRQFLAMRMARRHLVAENGDAKLALKKMKSTIEYRQSVNVDDIRLAFYESKSSNEERNQELAHIRQQITKQLETGKFYVRGYDRRGTATFVGVARCNNSDDPEWYIKANIYTLERALAATEQKTNGKEEKICAVFDYNGYTSANAPPISLTRELLYGLKDHYPERLQHVFVIDAPVVFRGFWYLVKPFLDAVTKKKVQFVTGSHEKELILGPVFSKDQAMDFMFSDGEKTKPLDLHQYLYKISFDKAYEEN